MTVTILQAVAWPAVAVVAIIALLTIVVRAVSSGRSVAIDWRVTEKITGRVMITKARTRVKRHRASA